MERSNSAELLSTILDHYGLTQENCNEHVSDSLLEKFCQSHCEKWRLLTACLKMKAIAAKDIDRGSKDEDEKRLSFFRRWKHEKGFDATYKVLISALLDIDCRGDAESVCKLMKKSLSDIPQHAIRTTKEIQEPTITGS